MVRSLQMLIDFRIQACVRMVEGVESVLGDRVTRGALVTKYEHTAGHRVSPKIQLFEASHPTPDQAGVDATLSLLEEAKAAGERSLVVACISGGSTALLVAPVEGVTLAEKQEATRQLLGCGCPIEEKNAVLKHLSRVKAPARRRATQLCPQRGQRPF